MKRDLCHGLGGFDCKYVVLLEIERDVAGFNTENLYSNPCHPEVILIN